MTNKNQVSGGVNCAEWNLVVYVQGKLVNPNENGDPMVVCKSKIFDLFWGPTVTVDIPNDAVEGPHDYQPLSIFTVGWQKDNLTCPQDMNAPEELPEVLRILTDQGSTRPYYADAREKIARIQHEVQNQISVDCPPTPKTQDLMNKNQKLDTVNILEASPGYGKKVAADTVGNPPTARVKSCSEIFCLYYTISCPLCPAVREH